MSLSNDQIRKLIDQVAGVTADELGCDGCFERIAEFAEAQLANRELDDAMQAVEIHLRSCQCCNDEYQALLEGLQAIDQSND